MGYEVEALVLYDSVLFGVGHNVRRWADSVERNYTANAIAAAPVNKRPNKSRLDWAFPPGSLKSSIRGEVDRIGPKHLQIVVSVNVPYATFVIRGTDSPITPTSAPKLRLPWNPGYGRIHKGMSETRVDAVSGQQANNFLQVAHSMTARIHPSLRGGEHLLFQQF